MLVAEETIERETVSSRMEDISKLTEDSAQ
jgi:hypothetical protein